jgi:hypothetical protein
LLIDINKAIAFMGELAVSQQKLAVSQQTLGCSTC